VLARPVLARPVLARPVLAPAAVSALTEDPATGRTDLGLDCPGPL
jgi:hypothetical protein